MGEEKIYGSQNRKKLYDNLSQDYDLGTFDDFNRNMDDEGTRLAIYKAGVDAGWELPAYDQFAKDMTVRQMKVNGQMQEVDHDTYDNAHRPKGAINYMRGAMGRMAQKSQQKPAQQPVQEQHVNAEDGMTYTQSGLDSLEAGYTPQAVPSQEPVQPQQPAPEQPKPQYASQGTPYRPDHQTPMAQRAEAYKQNDFMVDQMEKFLDKQAAYEEKRNKPIVETGHKGVDTYLIKSQKNFEREIEQGASKLSQSVVIPTVDKVIADYEKKAHEAFVEAQKGSTGAGMLTGVAGGFQVVGAQREANKAKDPDKILADLVWQMEKYYTQSLSDTNKEFIEKAFAEADSQGLDREMYLEYIMKPQILSDLENYFANSMIAKELPKSSLEYIVNGLGDSIFGMLVNAFTETKGQRFYKNQAEALMEEGKSPYYNPGTAAKLGRMGVSFAADAPFFGVFGKVSGTVAKKVAERQISNLMAKGLSETAARSIVGAALENSVGARMKQYLMQHVISSSLTLGMYNAASETARQTRDSEFNPLAIAGSAGEGLMTGAAFGATGGAMQAVTQPLKGIYKIGGKLAGFGVEGETMYATEELAKMMHGQEGFDNPFEGSLEAMMKLGVIKASGGHFAKEGIDKIIRTGEIGFKQAAQETLGKLLGQQKTGVKFTDKEKDYVVNSTEGQNLIQALTMMHPEVAISEANGKKTLTPEGEAQRQQLSEAYDGFMQNPEIPATVKQKVAAVLGGVYRPGLETGADIIHNADGSVVVKTRDKDGNCVQEIPFNSFTEADNWRDAIMSQLRHNDAVNMYNGTTDEQRAAIVADIAEMNSVSYEDARKILYDAMEDRVKSGVTDEQYGSVIDAITRLAYPRDEYNPAANFQQGKTISAEDRHYAMADVQVAEEQLMQYGEDFANEVMTAESPDEKLEELAMRTDVTGDMIKAAVQYYNDNARLQGMMQEAMKSIDEQVNEANAKIQRNTHSDLGVLIMATVNGRNVYVNAGHLEITPDGKLLSTDGSQACIIRDAETDEIDVVNPETVRVYDIRDPRPLIEANESMDGLRGQLTQQVDDTIEYAPGTPMEPSDLGEIFVGLDGQQYMVSGQQDATGAFTYLKIPVDETGMPIGQPMPLDINEYRKAKSNEIDAANRPQETLLENQEIQQAGVPETEAPVEELVQTPAQETGPVAGGEAGREKTRVDEPPVAAQSRIPVNEKGQPIYEQARPEDTLADLNMTYGEEGAQVMITRLVENISRKLAELETADLSDITDINEMKAHSDEIKALREKLEYWQGLVKAPAVEPEPVEEPAKVEAEAPETVVEPVVDEQPVVQAPAEPETKPEVVQQPTVQVQTQPAAEKKPASPYKPAEEKIYRKTTDKNIGRTFTFTDENGVTTEITIERVDYQGNAVLTRRDFDAQGKPIGEPREQRVSAARIGEGIQKKQWKKIQTVEERLRKVNKQYIGDINLVDVLSDAEQRELLRLYESGDKEAIGNMVGELIREHRDDIILKGRDYRNAAVDRAFGKGKRAERLRAIREQYKDDRTSSYLTDDSMEPQSVEEWVAHLLGDVPVPGNGAIAYESYGDGQDRVVGLKEETGLGNRGFGGDTKGFNPWLAPKGKGMSLARFAENLRSQMPEAMQEQYSDQDIRNIVLDILTGAEKPTDIANYILRNRVDQAEAEARRQEEEWMEQPNFQKVVEDLSFAPRLQRAVESVNTEPTEGQKKAGNYKMGHISFGGYDYTIENPKGSVRRGKDAKGKPWENTMANTYGYILGKKGKDGDNLDMFINDDADLDNWDGTVYVIDQVDPKTGKFDEHKVMYGFNSEAEARAAYLANYAKGWKGLGNITGVDKATFDKWLDSSDRKLKEFAEHSIPKNHRAERLTSFDSALRSLDEREISIDDEELLEKYGLKSVILSRLGDHLTLTHFVVDNQGQGNGSRFMEDLTRLADEKGWTLCLTPDTSFGGTSVKRLKDFYKRFGFKDNKGRNTDFGTMESMVRRPKDWVPATPSQKEQTLRDAIVEHLRSKGIQVSTDWQLGQKILDDYQRRVAADEAIADEEAVKSQKVTDQEELDMLNNGPTVKRYRAMQLIDGKLYPPMSGMVDGQWREPTEIGVWERSEERPDLLDKNGKFKLRKGLRGKGRGDTPAAYNPYFHTSTSGLNDQFTAAYQRPELVVVEVEIPESELTSGYQALGAKDHVGDIPWHSGPVNGQLPEDRKRTVTLSRWSKVNRVVPDSEVADMIAKQLEGTDIEVPYNVVTPALRAELEQRGVKISETPSGTVTEDINGNPIKQQNQPMFFRTPDGNAYGYTYKGQIYIDPRIATAETPIHEYGHLWAEMKRNTSPEEWEHIKQVMLTDKLVQPIIDRVKRDYPELSKEGKEDQFIEEIITQFSGQRGAERLRAIAEEVAAEHGGVFGKAEAITAMQRLKNILNRFWEGVAKMMGWDYRNANQIADRIMADWLNGINPREQMERAAADATGTVAEQRAKDHKQQQLDIILRENPADDKNTPGHTWIRSIDDIKTYEEALEDDGLTLDEDVTPDFTADMVKEALETGTVTVYSSKPIKDGTFVTPSKMEAESYAGGGKVYSKEVSLDDVAWIDGIQGQYAKVPEKINQQKVDYDSAEEKQRTETIFNAAKKLFGTTRDIREAGYVLPDGTMPDFSGRHIMNPGSDTSFLRGRRTTDHRDIQSIAYERDGNTKTGIETDMPDFIRRGAIRIDNNSGSINLSMKPTDKQRAILRQLIAYNDGYVQVNFGDGWDSDHYVEYSEAKPSKVLADIDRYFDEGIKPQGDEIKYQLVGKEGAEKADNAEGNTKRQDNLKLAEEAEKDGYDAKAIKFATGWERGVDGKWRYEIPDADADVLGAYKKARQEHDKEYARLDKEADNLQERYQNLNARIPQRLDSRYTEEQKAMYREMRKQREKLWKQYLEADKKATEFDEKGISLTLGELLGDGNELFKYYPELKDTKVTFPLLQDGTAGSYGEDGIKVGIDELRRFDNDELNNENVYATLLHEVQHAIQDIEGFAKGGNLYTSTTDEGINAILEKKQRHADDIKRHLDANNKILNNPDELKEFAELEGKSEQEFKEHLMETVDQEAAEYDNLKLQIEHLKANRTPTKSEALDVYHRLSGEVESRNVSNRMKMTDQERLATLASETEDVPRDEQVIIKGNSGESASMGDGSETFDERQKRAVENYGIVMPGLNDKSVEVIEVPKHQYSGSWEQARKAAIKDAKEKYTRLEKDDKGKEKRVPIPQQYDNFGQSFKYTISGESIAESVNKNQVDKSLEQNAPRGVHLSVLNHLDEVINNSIEVEEHPDYNKGDDDKRRPENGFNPSVLMHRFIGVVNVDGKPYRVMTLMKEFKQKELQPKEYAYDVEKIEVLDDMPNTSNGAGKAISGPYPLANLLKDIVKSYEKEKNLLKESEKLTNLSKNGQESASKKEKASRTSLNTPSVDKGEGAVSPDASLSEGKDNKNINTIQENGEKSAIQGLENYSEDDVKDIVRDYVQQQIGDLGLDAEVVDIKVIGSRAKGDADKDSDLDVLLEYKGREREDDLFNALNDADEPLMIEDIKVDINPITKGKSGTIAEFLERNADYRKDEAPKFQKTAAERVADTEIGGALVDRLQDMGVDVSTDWNENRKTRKAAEKDTSETGKMRQMKKADGDVYGFVYKGKIHLDPRKIDAEAPIHEYGHLWCGAFRKLNPDGWQSVVDVMKKDADAWSVIKKLNPDITNEHDIAEEMIANYSGKRGAERLRVELAKMSLKDPSYSSKWGNIYQNISKAIQDFWKKMGDFLYIKYESPEQIYDQVMKDFANKMNPQSRVERFLEQRDKDYLKAVEDGDKDKAKELFDEALRENVGNGMTPFIAVNNYFSLRNLAKGVKKRNPETVAKVADMMTSIIPKDAVLVPAPSHEGYATDMLDLAKALSERTGAPVADVLKSGERESQAKAKKAGQIIESKDMGIVVDGKLPEGKIPVVIDNVVDTGNTAEACVQALGKGIVASLADSADRYKHVASLKSAEPVVIDRNGDVVPLSKRFEWREGSKRLDKHPRATKAVEESTGMVAEPKITETQPKLRYPKTQSVIQLDLFEQQEQQQKARVVSINGKKTDVKKMSDEKLLEGMSTNSPKDRDFLVDEYDQRHREEYNQEVENYTSMLEQDNTSLDDAYGMYANIHRQWVDGGFKSVERTKLMAQIDALEGRIDILEQQRLEREEREFEAQLEREEAEEIDNIDEKQAAYEEQKTDVRAHGYDLTQLKMRELTEGESCHVERRYTENRNFSFTGGERIESAADVAYIFRELENAAVENAFVVMIKDGQPTVVHVGMGAYNGTVADIRQALAAAELIKPDKIWFLHNHPSGQLVASKPDIETQTHLENMFPGAAQPGIIIDTKSGKYGEFSSQDYHGETHERPQSVKGDEIPVKVFNFSTAVFDESWNPEEAFMGNTPRDVAAFVSSHRLGDHNKLSLLILDQAGHITGNVFLPWTDVKEAAKERNSARMIATYVNQMGGIRCIIYGNDIANSGTDKAIYKLYEELNEYSVRLFDVVSTARSARMEGVVSEPEPEVEAPKFQKAPVFVSNAMKAVEGIKQEKATPEQWLAMISKNGGLKAGEDKWLGLSEWLKGDGKDAAEMHGGTITKQDILDYIRKNQIQVEEVTYGQKDTPAYGNWNREGNGYRNAYDDKMFIEDVTNTAYYDGKKIDTFDNFDDAENALIAYKYGENPIHPTRLDYTTNGLDNKREIALVVPTIESWNEGDQIHFGDAGGGRAVAWIRFGEKTGFDEKLFKAAKEADKAYYGYLDKMAEKYNTDGGAEETLPKMTEEERAEAQRLLDASRAATKALQDNEGRTLVIDEIQSKRHQEGREKGYVNDEKVKAYNNWLDNKAKELGVERYQVEPRLTDEEYREMKKLQEAADGVPDAPFDKNWHELAMKRMLRYAAENGYDKVAWTTGEQQAERYNIGGIVPYIDVKAHPGADYFYRDLRFSANGNSCRIGADKDGIITHAEGIGEDAVGKSLGEVFGKEVAIEIMSTQKENRIQLEGKRIGGEGMKGFYDDMLVRFMNKYGKKWGVQVGSVQLPGLENNFDGIAMHSVDVTPEMKESVMEGQPMFQREGQVTPELTPEDKQYWNQWQAAMNKWRERNAIAEGVEGPMEKPTYQRGENALEYGKRLAQWNRDKALWATAPKLEDYKAVRDDKDIMEDARTEEQRYPHSEAAKRRRVAAELARMRHAMSRQKAYDKTTVKAVTDFANDFMKMGFGDNLRRSEIERMLSSVKNATGAKDIKKYVDNIMDILLDNHLRNLENRVWKVASVRELKQTAQGVEAQGKLELKGQRMIQAFREATQNRMTAEDIRNRMAEVLEKMNANEEEAPMYAQEYEGLDIALQYVEDINASRQEWADLDKEYKDAVKDYRTSDRSYQAQQELLESIEQAMMENKIDRINYYGRLLGRLEGDIAESIEGAKEFVQKEKDRVAKIQRIANYDLAGKDMSAFHQNDWKKRLVNSTPARFFLAPLGTFEMMLKQFGARNANGEGNLYNYFMRTWIDSVDKAYVNEQAAKAELDAKAKEVFGKAVKRWSDLYEIERKLPTMDVEVIDQGEKKRFTLTQGNLLYIYMANKMADGKMKLRKMGIDDAEVEAIADFLDPRLKELGDWLQDEYMVNRRVEYNKVHERMFGAPMAAIDNYFPIKILGDARVQEQDVANMADQDAVLPSTITGSIVKRRRNALPLDILGTDALSLAIEHIEDMERWAATAEFNKDINTLLSYTTFRNKVKNMTTIYGSGDQLWNTFADAARMAAGTYRPKVKTGSADKAFINVAKGVTAAKINFRVYTAFKQILSAPAFLHDVNLGDFVKDAANPYGCWKWAMENMPVFAKRWKSRQVGDTRLMDDPTDWKLWHTNIVKMATRMGMSPNALVDGVTCAVGARAIYQTRYKKYKKLGAPDEVANKRALQDAEIGYNETQQSSEGAFVSAIQKDRTVFAVMLSTFRNSSMSYTRQWVIAMLNLSHRAQKGYKEDAINYMANQFKEDFDMTEEDAKDAAKKEYARAARHDVARLLNMMFGVTFAWNLGASLPYLLMGDDDETKKEMMKDAAIRAFIAGPTEGLAAGNYFSDFISRTAASEETRRAIAQEGWGAGVKSALEQGSDYEIGSLPLVSDMENMIKKIDKDNYAAAQELFNICMQSAVGVNPQTYTDMWNACMDYGNPDWMPFTNNQGNDDLANSKEIALFIMRLMNAPTSSWRNKYIDELGMNVEDAKKLPYEEMAARYANYKHWKDAPLMGWLRSDEERQAKMDKAREQFDKAVKERMERLSDKELMSNLARSQSSVEKRMLAKIVTDRLGMTPGTHYNKPSEKQWYQEDYQERMLYDDIKEDELLSGLVNNIQDKTAKSEVRKRLDWIRDGYYASESGRPGSGKKEYPLISGGKKQLKDSSDADAEKIMRNIRKWRKEALEIALKAQPK